MKISNPILIYLIMPITTPHLLIKPPQIADDVVVHAGILESVETLSQYTAWAKKAASVIVSPSVVASEARQSRVPSFEPWIASCLATTPDTTLHIL